MSTGELGSEDVGTAIAGNAGDCTRRYGDEPTENSDLQDHRCSLLFRIELGCNSDKHAGLLMVVRFYQNTGCLQKNGAVSKVNKKFISHLTRAKPTPSAAATVHVSHALPAVRFSCLLRGRGVSFQDGVAA